MYWQSDRQKRKEFDKVVEERKAREKNEAWIRELEARDEEEKEFRRMREAKRRGVSMEVVLKEELARDIAKKEEKDKKVLEKVVQKGASSVVEVEGKKK